jgi:hypothetical protein
MRRLLTGLVVAATTVLIPVLAAAGNQEAAEKIAKALSASGQMYDYKVGVKYQGGTVWLRGQVANEEQAQTAMALVRQMPGVTDVVSNLTVAQSPSGTPQPLRMIGSQGEVRIQASEGAVAPEQTVRATAAAPKSDESGTLSKYLHTLVPDGPSRQTAAQPVATSYAPMAAQPVNATMEQGMTAEAPRTIPTTVAQRAPMPAASSEAVPAGNAVAAPIPAYVMGARGVAPARYDQPCMPNYAWPSYAAYPNYAGVTYPRQYSPSAWPYIGPFYPYPQVPLGWRKVTLQWDDGWWMLDFKDK